MPLTGQAAFRRIVWTALVASLIAGGVVTVVQWFTTGPLIARAENYEHAAHRVAPAAAPELARHDSATHNHDVWAPGPGWERTLFTGLTNVLAAFGYGLLLGACMSWLGLAGWRHGVTLGLAGFVIFQVAPSMGMPPTLPGVATAQLLPRQLWWLGTVTATALAMLCGYRARQQWKWRWLLLAVLLAVLPHVVGAPKPPVADSAVPNALLREFAMASLLTAALFWAALGGVQGYLFGSRRRALAHASADAGPRAAADA